MGWLSSAFGNLSVLFQWLGISDPEPAELIINTARGEGGPQRAREEGWSRGEGGREIGRVTPHLQRSPWSTVVNTENIAPFLMEKRTCLAPGDLPLILRKVKFLPLPRKRPYSEEWCVLPERLPFGGRGRNSKARKKGFLVEGKERRQREANVGALKTKTGVEKEARMTGKRRTTENESPREWEEKEREREGETGLLQRTFSP